MGSTITEGSGVLVSVAVSTLVCAGSCVLVIVTVAVSVGSIVAVGLGVRVSVDVGARVCVGSSVFVGVTVMLTVGVMLVAVDVAMPPATTAGCTVAVAISLTVG